MSKSIVLSLLVLPLILLFSACKTEANKSKDSANKNAEEEVGNTIPPQPRTRNTDKVPFFECMVDGQVFESAVARGSYVVDEGSDKVLIDMSAVSGRVPGQDFISMIGLVIEEFNGTGKYEGYKSFYYKKIVQGQPEMLEWESDKGSLNITHWDEKEKLLSGTFATQVKNDKGKVIRIEAGKFKNVPLEVLKVK